MQQIRALQYIMNAVRIIIDTIRLFKNCINVLSVMVCYYCYYYFLKNVYRCTYLIAITQLYRKCNQRIPINKKNCFRQLRQMLNLMYSTFFNTQVPSYLWIDNEGITLAKRPIGALRVYGGRRPRSEQRAFIRHHHRLAFPPAVCRRCRPLVQYKCDNWPWSICTIRMFVRPIRHVTCARSQ